MTHKWKHELNNDEYNFIVDEVSNRILNLCFEKSKEYADYFLRKLGSKNIFNKIKPNDEVNFSFSIKMIGNDLIEIIGKYDRGFFK